MAFMARALVRAVVAPQTDSRLEAKQVADSWGLVVRELQRKAKCMPCPNNHNMVGNFAKEVRLFE